MTLPSFKMNPIDTILSANGRNFLGTRPIQSNTLLTFEQLNQFSGFVLYETMLPALSRDPSNLIVTDLRDRALIYIDDEFVGALSRENYINTMPISAGYGSKLEILVENQGRINFDIANDYKVCRQIKRLIILQLINIFREFWAVSVYKLLMLIMILSRR